MKKHVAILSAAVLSCLLFVGAALAQQPSTPVPTDARKQTTLGKYCTAMEAYLMWRAKPKEVVILDVRSPEEYVFVGHPEMALNIPVQFFSPAFDAEKKSYGMAANPDFVAQVAKKLDKNATIIAMCRSGQRSAAAVNLLAAAGYTNVWSMVDSFEGDAVTDPENLYNGKRMKNGWKNYGLPWTYALNPAQVFVK
ncbi:Thiosulfate sulfurtransferase GlpE [Fundidesulfovibrio magnetotacticus]|uniref:Thiosulfate sulfurtransferase GlpE n=1 Tax=Fundidesulfovibrio magnetotacticus TaxID=2730080 RepID=A0A6V8M2H9_9BACT|nr:rhodanese-like domain-containing protein [Fundidesulfovibrio magnetotacticus]GFK96126.1 Thiosulfate sulfurtransferase GlpE [Fundidesulfovibrio magnetotacticus]